MKVKLHLIAEITVGPGSRNPLARARSKLDAFREAVLPSKNYGITLYEPTGDDLAYVQLEEENDDPHQEFEGKNEPLPRRPVWQAGRGRLGLRRPARALPFVRENRRLNRYASFRP